MFATMQWIRCSLLIWSVFEALRYWRMMRRRLALGLADALVTNRIALWGTAMLGALIANLFGMWSLRHGAGILEVGSVWNLIPATAGLLAAGCLFLGFMPPAFYRGRLEARAAAA